MHSLQNRPRRWSSPAWVFVQLTVLLAAVSLISAWVTTNYLSQNPGTAYSFAPADGWCDPASEGVGIHCAGDFQFPRVLLDDPSAVWANKFGIPHSLTPTGMVPHLVGKAIADTGLGVKASLWIYLAIVGVALMAPAVLVIATRSSGWAWLLPLVVVGMGTQPFLMTLDRGSSVGLAVPALLLFALTLDREPYWIAPTAVVVASCLRPQYILLVLAFIAFARWRALVATVTTFLAVQVVAFLAWPGSAADIFGSWFRNTLAYSNYGDLGADGSTNVSSARAIALMGRALQAGPGRLSDLGQRLITWVSENPAVPGLVLTAACALVLALRRRRIPRSVVVVIALALPTLAPGTSFGYYLIFALVVGATIWGPRALARPAGRWELDAEGSLEALEGRPWCLWRWLVVGVTATTLFPLPWRFLGGEISGILQLSGAAWTLVVVSALGITLAERSHGKPHEA